MVKLLRSPSIITWSTMLLRAIVVVFVTPIILVSTNFPEEESANWILYLTVYNLVMLLDVGFTPTFVRHFAYSLSCKNKYEGLTTDLLVMIQNKIYLLISGGALFFVVAILIWSEMVLSIGSFTFSISVVSVLYTGRYISVLEGIGKILLARTVILCQVLSQILFLSLSLSSELSMDWVLTLYYFPCVVTLVYLRYMGEKCLQTHNTGNFVHLEKYTKEICKQAGKSAISLLSTVGAIQIITLYYSQLKEVDNSAAILYSMMLIRQIANFSQVPFYTKIPLLSSLHANGDIKRQKYISFVCIGSSIFLLFISGLCVSLLNELFQVDGRWHLPILSSQMWMVLVFSFMIERSLAMLQHYLATSNIVVWHVTGPLFCLFTLIGFYYCVVQNYNEYSVSLPILLSSLLILIFVSVRFRRIIF